MAWDGGIRRGAEERSQMNRVNRRGSGGGYEQRNRRAGPSYDTTHQSGEVMKEPSH